MARLITSAVLGAGALAMGKGAAVDKVIKELRAHRHRTLKGNERAGRYLGDGDVVVILVDQGAGELARRVAIEALGVAP